jgi:hypothetical protein
MKTGTVAVECWIQTETVDRRNWKHNRALGQGRWIHIRNEWWKLIETVGRRCAKKHNFEAVVHWSCCQSILIYCMGGTPIHYNPLLCYISLFPPTLLIPNLLMFHTGMRTTTRVLCRRPHSFAFYNCACRLYTVALHCCHTMILSISMCLSETGSIASSSVAIVFATSIVPVLCVVVVIPILLPRHAKPGSCTFLHVHELRVSSICRRHDVFSVT